MEKQEVKLPSWFNGQVYSHGEVVTNPFSGDSIKLNAAELSMYDLIIGAQALHAYDIMQKGLGWFRKTNPEAYMVLLD